MQYVDKTVQGKYLTSKPACDLNEKLGDNEGPFQNDTLDTTPSELLVS